MIKINNTLTNKKEEFVPVESGKVRMYVCGPTVYDYFHIGNGRAFLFFDVVRRYFEYQGYQVLYVQNLTDIDDKIINRANQENTTIDKISAKYIKAFKEDIKALGIKEATFFPKATAYVSKMIDFIENLERKGYAYNNNGNVFFPVNKLPGYGKLSGKNIKQLLAGARVEQNSDKKFAGDFALWKRSKLGEPYWESPWGKGRPGWHTECVVMAKDLVEKDQQDKEGKKANVFDIHAGGIDLVFPHHENELAQAQASMNCDLAAYWMHNGFIDFEGEKMSKSLGNFFTIRDILKKYDAEVLRHFYLSKHYRSSIDFNEKIINESQNALNKLYQPLGDYFEKHGVEPEGEMNVKEYAQEFCRAMNDDFNTARALAVMFELTKEINKSQEGKDQLTQTLVELGRTLGFFQNLSGKVARKPGNEYNEKLIEILINYRAMFKKEKNWRYADMIRDDLAKIGIILQDTPKGTKWLKK